MFEFCKKFFAHLGKVLTHKFWVFVYCAKAGLVWRGLTHDLSKFSPTEFLESVNGTKIKAWFHHKGRNSHHYEYWTDFYGRSVVTAPMPFEDALEMVCDYLGAGRAYNGKNFSYGQEWEWWKRERENAEVMNSETKKFVDKMMYIMSVENSAEVLDRRVAKSIYDEGVAYLDKGRLYLLDFVERLWS